MTPGTHISKYSDVLQSRRRHAEKSIVYVKSRLAPSHFVLVVLFISLVFSLSCNFASAQIKYPVTANINAGFPQPVYLADYYQTASNNLSVNLILNDLNEPFWNVRLKFTITGTDLKIVTKIQLQPSQPIELTSGMLVTLRDSELTEYLSPDRVVASGSAASLFNQTGRLKEGVYNVCVEVLDYNSGVPISLPACTTVWIQLKEPPVVISPQCGSFIAPVNPQSVLFQWQPVTFGPGENANIQYIINLYELTNDEADPEAALQNGEALQVFESDPLVATTYIYGLADPPLEVGKQYLYTIRAVDSEGKELIKNKGYSEVCHFYYGYPEGGVIALRSPANKYSFGYDETPVLGWNCTDKRIPNQPFSYEIKVVKILEGQDSLSAMEENEPWYSYSMPSTNSVTYKSHTLRKILDPLDNYAWKITAYSGEQKVAESAVNTFTGPPFLDKFNAGGYVVQVLRTDNRDVSDLKGRCLLRLGSDSLTADFDHLQLKFMNMKYFLESGEILFDNDNSKSIPIAPLVAENDTVDFLSDQVKLSKEGLKIHGFTQIKFPHPTLDKDVPYLKTKAQWYDYAMLKITGVAFLEPNQEFDLLDPLGFKMDFAETSVLIIDRGKYRAEFDGKIFLPEEEKIGKAKELRLAFKEAPHLMYFDKTTLAQDINLPLIRRTNFSIDSEELIFDLSNEKSPGIHEKNASWKGLYFSKYKINISKEVDEMDFWAPGINHAVDVQEPSENRYAWISGGGLNFLLDYHFQQSDSGSVYSFSGKLDELKVKIIDRSVDDSQLSGSILIPFVSESKRFSFLLPLTYTGFTAGHLAGLEDYQYVFNPTSEDQKVPVKILRAEFEGNDRITASVDFDFPSLHADVPVVSNLKIWGNGEIGFKSPNGSVAFNKQINGKVSTFPIVVDAIGAGRNKNYYTIAAQVQVNMSEDISGLEGAPLSNFYSVSKNSLLDEDYEPAEVALSTGGTWNPVLGYYDESDLEEMGDEEIAKAVAYEMESQLNSNPDEDRELIDGLLSAVDASPTSEDQPLYESPAIENGGEEQLQHELSQTRDGVFAGMSEKEVALVEAIVETFVDELSKPVTRSIDDFLTKIALKADSTIYSATDKAGVAVGGKIDDIMAGLSVNLAGMLPDDKPAIKELLQKTVDATGNSIRDEFIRSLHQSVKEVIRDPIVTDLSVVIPDRINDTIRITLTHLVIRMLEGDVSGDYIKDEVAGNLWKTAKSSGEYVYSSYIKPEALLNRIETLGDRFISNYDWNNVLNQIKDQLIDPKVLAETVVQEYGAQLISNAVGDDASGNELVAAGMSMSRSLSFKDGKLKLDPSNINIVTSWLSFTGVTNFRADDPVYGDVWDADITIVIHKPKDMSFKGRYMNGRAKDGTDFWFAELSTASKPADGSGGGKDIGGDITQDIKPLERPINLGVAKLAAASLRVYKHMIDTTGAGIIPDPNVKYGGYFHFVLLDGKNDGRLFRLELAGKVIQGNEKDAFVLDFLGDLQIINSNPKVEKADGNALAHAGIKIHYNGLEDHFLGYAFLEITSGVCLFASMEIETKPGYWHVYIGDEINKIRVTPGCVAWGGMGYMKLDNKTLEVALGVSYSFYFKKDLDFKAVKLGILIDAYAAIGIVAGMQYNPNFKLLKAGIWLELYAHVMLNYAIKLAFIKKSGSLELLEFYLRASLVLTFEPKPATMVGDAEGYLKVLNGLINARFKAHMEKSM